MIETDIDITILIVTAFIMGMAPFAAVVWIFIAKMGLELFSPADVHGIQDKVNPVLIPGTQSTQSSQAVPSSTCLAPKQP